MNYCTNEVHAVYTHLRRSRLGVATHSGIFFPFSSCSLTSRRFGTTIRLGLNMQQGRYQIWIQIFATQLFIPHNEISTRLNFSTVREHYVYIVEESTIRNSFTWGKKIKAEEKEDENTFLWVSLRVLRDEKKKKIR